MTNSPKAPHSTQETTAKQRLMKFVNERATMGGVDQENIYTVHTSEGQQDLTTSDIKSVCSSHDELVSALKRLMNEHANGDDHKAFDNAVNVLATLEATNA